jgi:4'-phosphopantetheinyl transferase
MLTAIEHWNTTDTPRPLRAGEVHLWRARLEPTAELRDTLSPEEWIRASRFHFERDRERHVATRGLVRTILAGYLHVDAHEIEFATGAHGKPEIRNPATLLRFNVSHSDNLMMLAVTHGRELGIDLELMQQNLPFETLADHYFDPEEAWELRQLPANQRAWKFYDVWTCTEASLKASGVGLANGPRVLDPDRWSLLKLAPAAGFTATLAVEGGDFQVECCSWPT